MESVDGTECPLPVDVGQWLGVVARIIHEDRWGVDGASSLAPDVATASLSLPKARELSGLDRARDLAQPRWSVGVAAAATGKGLGQEVEGLEGRDRVEQGVQGRG